MAAKQPVKLPKRIVITDMIVRHYHHTEGHSGPHHVLSQHYWIVNGLSAVKRILNKCIECRKQSAPLGEHLMAQLPEDRLQGDEPPFTYVGIDYFGPFLVKQGRSKVKRYGCIFTCLTSRAIHLEVAHTLETDSFLAVLLRFMSSRGSPKVIRSVNGTNSTWGQRELAESIRNWNQQKISNFLLRK